MRLFTLALGLGLAISALGLAGEKKETPKEAKLSGKWTKSGGGFTLALEFNKDDVVIFSILNETDGCIVENKAKIGADKVECEVTKFTKKGNFPVEKEKGYKFSFEYKKEEKKLIVKKFTGDDVDENAKEMIEGEYLLSEK